MERSTPLKLSLVLVEPTTPSGQLGPTQKSTPLFSFPLRLFSSSLSKPVWAEKRDPTGPHLRARALLALGKNLVIVCKNLQTQLRKSLLNDVLRWKKKKHLKK